MEVRGAAVKCTCQRRECVECRFRAFGQARRKYFWTPELMAKADALTGDEQKQFERETQEWIDRMNNGASA